VDGCFVSFIFLFLGFKRSKFAYRILEITYDCTYQQYSKDEHCEILKYSIFQNVNKVGMSSHISTISQQKLFEVILMSVSVLKWL